MATALLGLSLSANAQRLEAGVKAAFIYNFVKYIDWPSSTLGGNQLVIGIVGQDSLAGALDAATEGKTVNGKRLVVRHVKWGQDLSGCNVLFIPASEMGGIGQLSRLKDKPVLTIGESAGFAKHFGILNFVIEDDRVRFEINAPAARQCGLVVSSKLLNLGRPPGQP